jgi:2-oxoglutarate dehydrogenase E1 component
MGAWSFVSERIAGVAAHVGFEAPQPRYTGRPASASPATGNYARHLEEQARLVDEALTVDVEPGTREASRKIRVVEEDSGEAVRK